MLINFAVRSIHEIFLTVDGCIMGERPECSLHLSREQAIAGSNAVADINQSDVYPKRYGHACTLIR